MPADVFTRATRSGHSSEPMLIDRDVLQAVLPAASTPAILGLEIVPWKPVPHVMAL